MLIYIPASSQPRHQKQEQMNLMTRSQIRYQSQAKKCFYAATTLAESNIAGPSYLILSIHQNSFVARRTVDVSTFCHFVTVSYITNIGRLNVL